MSEAGGRHGPHRLILAAVAVLLALATAGCGEDDPFEAYCAEVEANQARLTETLGAGGRTALLEALPTFEDLEQQAPEDLRDEWAAVTARITALRDALAAAAVDPGEYDRRDPPADVTRQERKAIDQAARGLTSSEMTAALQGVQQQARDVCDTPLFL